MQRTGADYTETPRNAELHYIRTPFRGTRSTLAYTDEDSKCPNQTGHTWKYSNGNEWKDAGEGLEVKCAGQCFRLVKRNGRRNGACNNNFCCLPHKN